MRCSTIYKLMLNNYNAYLQIEIMKFLENGITVKKKEEKLRVESAL